MCVCACVSLSVCACVCVCVCAPPFPQTPYCQQRQPVQHLVLNPPVSPRSIAHISMYIYIHSLLFVDDSQVPPRSITHISMYIFIFFFVCYCCVWVCPKISPRSIAYTSIYGYYMHYCVCVCVCVCMCVLRRKCAHAHNLYTHRL